MPAPPKSLQLRASDLLLLLIVVLGLSRLLGAFITSAQSPFAPSSNDGSGLSTTFVYLILQFAVLLGGCYLIILRPYGLRLADLGLGQLRGNHIRLGAVGGLLALPLVTMVNYSIQSLQDTPFDNPQIDILTAGGMEPEALIGFLIMGGLAAPFAEEIAFRGILFGWLRGRMSAFPAIFLCGFFFALLHGFPQLVPALTVIGMLFAYLRLATDSLWPAMIAHGVFNMATTMLIYGALAQKAAESAGAV